LAQDSIISTQKSQKFWSFLEGLAMEDAGIFAIWSI
jgi:hypothetical protein